MLDPGSGGRVQAMIAGRVEVPPEGIASLGQSVKKGELFRPRASGRLAALERGGQTAQAAELRARWRRRKRLARLRELEATVARRTSMPQKPTCKACANARPRSVVPSATRRPARPVSGVVAAANVVAGQVVEARDVPVRNHRPEQPARRGTGLRSATGRRHRRRVLGQRRPRTGRAARLRRCRPFPARTGDPAALPCRGRQCHAGPEPAAEGHRADPLAGERRAATRRCHRQGTEPTRTSSGSRRLPSSFSPAR